MFDDTPKLTMQEIFDRHLPDTLFKSHYELAREYGCGHTPVEWRTFLRDNQLFIETELAAIAEAEARSALSRLGNASGTEVSAIKALLETSKLINDSQKQNTKVVLSFIPSTEEELEKSKPKPKSQPLIEEPIQKNWTPIKDDEFEPLPSLKELQERGEME
jgi:hypothetical protein